MKNAVKCFCALTEYRFGCTADTRQRQSDRQVEVGGTDRYRGQRRQRGAGGGQEVKRILTVEEVSSNGVSHQHVG